ncbi:CubicO group peptidase, beta-lactamase class C family [Nonomuraea solani]|uniref:CubicO group peptidase, beta-lactamase class C family n=1 Tax=Nonomuraea solani TaxID=1144553 RepID=A0A1H6EMG2_9ACTN|nr:serine hydrolase domain-containing protein [Nonomuraea solani]SEG98176.1 CubicO group peptidase, beta-lactamase class C family [Nonomuraea solani]
MSDLQKQVQEAADRLVESGEERGLQVAAYREGVQIVDVVAGVADPGTGRPVTSDTPFYNFSIGKGATATVAHLLAERGLFGYDTPVAELWPEFARHGKQGVTVRHVLSHTAGVPGVPLDTTPEDVCDWGKMVAALEDAELWWEPGTKVGYHAYTFGFLVGEIVRRVTGKPISQVLLEEVTTPLGVADELYFGMPEKEHARLARLEDAPADMSAFGEMPADLPMFRAAPMTLMPNAELGNRPDYLSADIPAGGKTSARAIARMYAALLGEVDGTRLISAERLREVTAVASSGMDEVFGMPSTWGLGFGIGDPASSTEPSPTTFGMAGAGGSSAWADTATGTTFALTKNRLTNDFSAAGLMGGLISQG